MALIFKQAAMKDKIDKELYNRMSKDLSYWKGPFYFNRKDPRIIVPKYNPLMGWTFNFANPSVYLLIVVVISLIIAISIFRNSNN